MRGRGSPKSQALARASCICRDSAGHALTDGLDSEPSAARSTLPPDTSKEGHGPRRSPRRSVAVELHTSRPAPQRPTRRGHHTPLRSHRVKPWTFTRSRDATPRFPQPQPMVPESGPNQSTGLLRQRSTPHPELRVHRSTPDPRMGAAIGTPRHAPPASRDAPASYFRRSSTPHP